MLREAVCLLLMALLYVAVRFRAKEQLRPDLPSRAYYINEL